MSHYFDKNQEGKLIEQEIQIKLKNKELILYSASSLFSKEKLDNGTKCLLENYFLGNSKKILDLGCGYGIVSVYLGINNKDLEIWASDTNLRAVEYTKKNCEKYKINAKVILSNLFEKFNEEKFDLILTNPPYVAGRKTCYAFIEESFKHLNKDGELQLVARHQKGGKMLEAKMQEVFGNVDVLGKGSGFRVYRSKKLII